MSTRYRLRRTARPVVPAPVLDVDQQRVVDHEGGPLLVLAGPGTGKTTTLVEAVVDRIDRRGLDPSQILVLTFSRKAADELRDRITARLQRTTAAPMSSTFHSFAYALVRGCRPFELYADPPRVLSSPEQDVRLRELLGGSRQLGTVPWPESLRAALGTRGFAREMHALLSRARELGLGPRDLRRIGVRADRPEWAAAGRFMEEYLTVLDFEGVLDYGELIHRAVVLAETDDVRADLRRRFAAVFVDEYQDTDPAQVRLLQALAGDGRDLVVVGDPDQSIYAFRGADVRGILDFPAEFPRAGGERADVIALGATRRFGSVLLAASRRVAAAIGVSGAIDAEEFRRFRNPQAATGGFGPGRVEVLTFTSNGAQAAHIADLIRRAHLEDGMPWHEIAVLVRSGMLAIPGLRRALTAAGVPVEVAGDELPLHAEPAVQPLLAALRAAVDPGAMDADTAQSLVLSPLADVDAPGLRQLGRELRRRAEVAGHRPPPASADLVRDALVHPELLDGTATRAAAAVRRLGELLARVHAELLGDQAAEQALWTLWKGTGWPDRLQRAAERGGGAARSANRDLDAVCALFEVAARAEEKQQHTSVTAFLAELEAQQLPADPRADRGRSTDAVRLLTAHRSKGLEWRLVVIAGVQEGSWPDLRRRGSLLRADRLGADGPIDAAGVSAMLAEERRLFYVACTRARERLVVTAVAAPEQDGEQPSRLLDPLAPPTAIVGRPARPLSLDGLVAELRRTAGDPTRSTALRAAAAARLARLAAESVAGRPVAAAADPSRWWGLREMTSSAAPVRPADAPVDLTASALGGLLECPLRWFLGREAAGESARSSAMGFGSVLHVLADHLARDPAADRDTLIGLLDSVWDGIRFDSRWIADRERRAAEEAIDRLLAWHRSRPDRAALGTEVEFDLVAALADGCDPEVQIHGRVDRLERDAEGGLHVVDIKTGKNPPSGSALADDPQLGLYQLACDQGGFAELVGDRARSVGAELVQLRVDAGGLPKVQEQQPQTPDESGRTPIQRQLGTAVETVREERFDAVIGPHCRFCDFAAMCPAHGRSATVLA